MYSKTPWFLEPPGYSNIVHKLPVAVKHICTFTFTSQFFNLASQELKPISCEA